MIIKMLRIEMKSQACVSILGFELSSIHSKAPYKHIKPRQDKIWTYSTSCIMIDIRACGI
jgi:hypothetical protein